MGRPTPKLPAEKIQEFSLNLNTFKLGTITLLEENRVPPTAMVESDNAYQVQDGIWAPKWGSDYYSLAAQANIDGAEEVVNPDKSTEILEVSNGKLWRSANGSTKTQVTVTNGTLTAGYDSFFKQIRGFMYITNGHDSLIRYDCAAKTAAGYTSLAAPTGLAIVKTGLSGTTYPYFYIIVASNQIGTTIGGTEVAVQVGKLRDDWTLDPSVANTTDYLSLTWNRVTGADRYSIFISDQSGYELYLDSVPDPGTGTTVTYKDDGTAAINDFIELPNDNTTTGPKFTQMELSGNRIWATGDPENPWRVYWAGVGQYTGVFSPYYGGGYIDLELGGRERPQNVVHYRDGKGTAYATVLTSDPEGNGSTWQIGLDTVTVGTTSFIVPSATKVVGSIGCSSPRGAAKVGDDIIFGNNKGAYSLGSQPSLLNVLATRELSANQRPTWRALAGPAMTKHANYHYDAKLFWALPAASEDNSVIWIRDIEHQNWQLAWKGVAVKSFFEYTDSTGKTHLLGVPVAGDRLIEFSPDIRGDFGKPYTVKLKTGIIPVNVNHNKFAQVNDIFMEVGGLIGTVLLDAYGYDYRKGFVYLGSLKIVGGSTSTVSWGQIWSTQQWSYIPTVQTTTPPSVQRKSKRINRLINSLQFIVSCTNINDYFELLEIDAAGFLVDVDPPSRWKSNTSSLDRNLQNAILDSDGNPILDDTNQPILG